MLDFLRAPPRRFVYLPMRLQRHERQSLISAAGFDLSCDLVQRAGRPQKNRAAGAIGRVSKVQLDAVTETGPRRHRRRHARLLSSSYVARHRNPTGYGSSNQLFT